MARVRIVFDKTEHLTCGVAAALFGIAGAGLVTLPINSMIAFILFIGFAGILAFALASLNHEDNMEQLLVIRSRRYDVRRMEALYPRSAQTFPAIQIENDEEEQQQRKANSRR